MVEKDVILEKVNSIQNCLQRIHNVTEHDRSDLEDLNVQDVVVLNLQRAVQLTIDLAAHVVSQKKLGLPQNLKDTFRILYQNKIIDQTLSKKMESMVGFRNVAVHDYQAIDPNILRSIVKSHLGDLEEFCRVILNQMPSS